MFAADSVLIQSHTDPKCAIKNLGEDLVKISDYFLTLRLKLNKKKVFCWVRILLTKGNYSEHKTKV